MMWNYLGWPGVGGYGYGGWFGVVMMILMMLWWVLIIVGIIALVRWMMNGSGKDQHERRVMNLLKERYAKGEIDKKEFEERKKNLNEK